MSRLFALWLTIAVAAPAAAQTVTPIEDVERGTMVTVAGVVERFRDEDEFTLRDETDTIAVYAGPAMPMLSLGERVVVSGFVDDDLFFRELYAREIVREDGEVVVLPRGY